MKPGMLAWTLFWIAVIAALPMIQGGTTYIPVTGLRLAALIMSCLFLYSIATTEENIVVSFRFNLPVLVIWILCAISLFITRNQYITIYWFVNIMAYAAVFYLGINCFGRPGPEGQRMIYMVAALIIITGAFEGAFGLARYFITGQDRATGTFFNPAFYAGFLVGASTLSLAFLLFPGSKNAQGKGNVIKKSLLAAALILMLLGMAYSGSRAAAAEILAVGVVLAARWKRLAPIMVLLIVAAVILIPNPLRERFRQLERRDIYAWERVNIWKSSIDMIRDNPEGVGLGMYKYYYFRHMRPVEKARFARYVRHANTAHSEPLHLACELNPLAPLILLIMAGALIFAGFSESIRAGNGETARETRPLIVGTTGALTGIIFQSCFDSNLHNPSIAVCAMALAAMLTSLLARSRPRWLKITKIKFAKPLLLKVMVCVAGIIFLLMFLHTGISYGLYQKYSAEKDTEARAGGLDFLAAYGPGYAPVYYELGKIGLEEYAKTGKIDYITNAIQYFDKAFRLNSENYLYPLEMSRAYLLVAYRTDKNGALLAMAEKLAGFSLRIHPFHPYTYSLLKDIARARGDKEAEIKWLEKALDIEPYYLAARADLVELLADEGKIEQALEHLDILDRNFMEVADELHTNPYAFPSLYEKRLVYMEKQRIRSLKMRFYPPRPLERDEITR